MQYTGYWSVLLCFLSGGALFIKEGKGMTMLLLTEAQGGLARRFLAAMISSIARSISHARNRNMPF